MEDLEAAPRSRSASVLQGELNVFHLFSTNSPHNGRSVLYTAQAKPRLKGFRGRAKAGCLQTPTRFNLQTGKNRRKRSRNSGLE